MKIKSAEFRLSSPSLKHCPPDSLPEIVLIGRSNVGKSSLINSLVNRKGLAKTSSAPGKTRTLNFYLINKDFYLVDLPGFGYAEAPKKLKRSWEKMIDDYLVARPNVIGALIILDIRRDAGETESLLYEWVHGFNVPVVTVLTKADKVSRNEAASRSSRLGKSLSGADSGAPVVFSAISGEGRGLLLKRINELLSVKSGASNGA